MVRGKGEEEEPKRRVVDKRSQEEKERVKEERTAEEGKRVRGVRFPADDVIVGDGVF